MMPHMQVRFAICLSDAETETTTSSLAKAQSVTDQLEREIYDITLK